MGVVSTLLLTDGNRFRGIALGIVEKFFFFVTSPTRVLRSERKKIVSGMLCIKNGCQLATDAGRSFLRPLIYFRSEITPLRVPMSYLSSRPISRWFITFSNRVYDWWILYERIIKFFLPVLQVIVSYPSTDSTVTNWTTTRWLIRCGVFLVTLNCSSSIGPMERMWAAHDVLRHLWRIASALETSSKKQSRWARVCKTTNGPFPYRRVCDNQTESRGMGPVFCSRPL